jgi:hypothetical protein
VTVHALRSGQVLHADARCPAVKGPTFKLDEHDALWHAARCEHPRCASVFARSAS